MSSKHACDDVHTIIRASSSSLIQAPSWSLGFGADARDCDSEHAATDIPNTSGGAHNAALLSTSLPGSSMANNIHSSGEPPACPRLYIEIPTVYLTREEKTKQSFHVYQLNIKSGASVEWSVYRRYSQFLALHQKLKACDSAIGKFAFPPKRRLNSKASTIVQDRRRKLEHYMQTLSDHIAKQPVLDSTNSTSYQLLYNLATNGPAANLRTASRTSSIVEETSSITDSTRSEHQDDHSAGDQDGIFALVEEATVEQSTSAPPGPSPVDEVSVSELASVSKTNNIKTTSVRYLFYNFISPDQAHDNEFELAQLGMR